MQFDAVVFDLDGTLLDTLDDLCDAMNRVLAARGFPVHGRDAYRYFVGDGAAMLVAQALPEPHRGEAAVRACLADLAKDYGANWNVRTKPYEGIPELLTSLTQRGIRLTVLSNKPAAMTERCVAELLAEWRFDVVLGQRDGIPRKPDPTGALRICETLNLAPERVFYLGDSGVDMQTARAAGMFAAGALWGFRTAQELLDNGAQALVPHPSGVAKLLLDAPTQSPADADTPDSFSIDNVPLHEWRTLPVRKRSVSATKTRKRFTRREGIW